jgi:DNA phosphorothioation-dependent restriction protein DptH
MIAIWGKVTLEPLDAAGISELVVGRSPRKGSWSTLLEIWQIRQAIKQSYVDLGWGSARGACAVPAFRTSFEILRTRPKPNAGVMARLSELADYGFFDSSGERRSLLDATEPSVIRIHGTTNRVLQQAFASFVLYSLYKDMFKRGVQKRITHAILFDEAHRASRLKLIPTFAKECRKYGLSLILASQEARDFDDSLFAAVGSYLVLRVTDPDAKRLARMTVASNIERQTADRLKALEKYHAVFFTEGRTRPTIMKLGSTVA